MKVVCAMCLFSFCDVTINSNLFGTKWCQKNYVLCDWQTTLC